MDKVRFAPVEIDEAPCILPTGAKHTDFDDQDFKPLSLAAALSLLSENILRNPDLSQGAYIFGSVSFEGTVFGGGLEAN